VNYERELRYEQDLVQSTAYSISGPLHYCTQTPKCPDAPSCDMCHNAARLAVGTILPKVRRRHAEMVSEMLGWRCPVTHVGGGDD